MTPDQIPPHIGIPAALVLWALWLALKAHDTRKGTR